MSMCTDLSDEIVRASLGTPTSRRAWAVSRVVNKFRCGRESPEESTTKKKTRDHYGTTMCPLSKGKAKKSNASKEGGRVRPKTIVVP